ncbi:MAG: sugar ABC transporter ATP-binding protein [Actinomycetota bacterium]|nr:sugar ABC transporter ATP-binding protein [Actinomycetota bacterium]
MSEYILELKNITKIFSGGPALDDVDFSLKYGEVHSIIGENGAGKSTLIKIITGVYSLTSGKIIYEDKDTVWSSPIESINKGIAAIYQEPAIFPDLNIAENIFMGHQAYNKYTRKISWRSLYKKTDNLMKELNIDLNPKQKIRTLSLAERQMVEIAKALSIKSKIIIMDEPTSALSISESEKLFEIIAQLKNSGVSVIFISHRIEDIFRVTDRLTVLRDGKCIGTKDIEEVTKDDLIQMMVGRKVDNLYPKIEAEIKEEILSVKNLSKKGAFKDVNFSLHEGEILGLYGLIGSGRTELAKAIFGMDPYDSGEVFLEGQKLNRLTPSQAIENGIAYIPENRDEEGIILGMNLVSNISLPILRKISKFTWLDSEAEKELTNKFVDILEIKASGIDQKVMNLSGGNKQKVSLAKWLATKTKIFIFDEPTKGIDVGAKASVHRFISELAVKGNCVLMISSDLPEIIGMSDNILIMHEGLVTGFFSRAEANQEKILEAALSNINKTNGNTNG